MKNLNAYDEQYASPKALSPAQASTDFGWEELYALLDEQDEDMNTPDWQALSQALAAIMQWTFRIEGIKLTPHTIGIRMIALAWAVNPQWIQTSPTLSRLATRCGVSKQLLDNHARKVRKRFGLPPQFFPNSVGRGNTKPKSSQTHPNESNPGNQPVSAREAGNEPQETTRPVKSRPVRLNQRT